MQRVVRKKIRHSADGIDLAADVQVVVSVNQGHPDASEPRDDTGAQRSAADRDDRTPPEEGQTK